MGDKEQNVQSAPVWVVDDDHAIRWVLSRALSKAGIECRLFEEAESVLKALEDSAPMVLVSDIRMPGVSGVDLLAHVKARMPNLPVIIMTAYSDLESAVSAFQGGAFEYLAKPFDITKAVELAMKEAQNMTPAVEAEAEQPASEESESQSVPDLIGQAPAMQEVFRAIGRLSHSLVTVLLTGESGAGKEVVARAIWRHSQRAAKPYIAINMAAIPRDLLESELFGHEKGAFTGATAQRLGRFEQARGGTLFLDEIGDMPMELQTRLLRVLSNGFFYRVGGHQPIKADVRIIAATNQNLEQRVKDGLFREDLYHRLNVIRLRLPPLRERPEDIAPLAEHFLRTEARALGVEAKRLTPEALARLEAFRRGPCRGPSRGIQGGVRECTCKDGWLFFGRSLWRLDGSSGGARVGEACGRRERHMDRTLPRLRENGHPNSAQRAERSQDRSRTASGAWSQHHHAKDSGTGNRGVRLVCACCDERSARVLV